MKRIQLFEFEDFDWLPGFIRTGATNLIVVLHQMLGTSKIIASLIRDAKRNHDFNQIVDLGSGSGGAMLKVIDQLNNNTSDENFNLVLSDLYPNPHFVKRINDQQKGHLKYSPLSVDATNFDNTPTGLKTMINSFHHMNPKKARQILHSAQSNRQPLLIYEMGTNFVPTLLWWIFLPLSIGILIIMVLFMTPFVRPLTWKQLVFTYIIPIIPLVYAWDGQASTMRMYTLDDVNELLTGMKDDHFIWKIEPALKENGKKVGYFIMGYPS